MTPPAELDLGDLGLDQGGHLLLRRALRKLPPGKELRLRGASKTLFVHVRAWCRAEGHGFALRDDVAIIERCAAEDQRWQGSTDTGEGGVADKPPAQWGLAARGATVEAGGPAFHFALSDKDEIWTEDAARLYARAAAAQWDPATAIDWDAAYDIPDEVEDAVVQVMTYLIENETAALVVPARFASQVHPHFREVMQLLAIQAADEARHIEIFTRRALLRRDRLGLSTVGGQRSLQTLVEEPDFALASFLLSVLGEGTFLHLLWFLCEHAPDPVTKQVCHLAAQDEARHVAFGLSHLQRHVEQDNTLRARLAAAIHQRHQALEDTAGLNAMVFDALLLLAAGSFDPAAIAAGWGRVQGLEADMHQGRCKRLLRLGFDPEEADALSALHTRNFM